MGGAKSYGGLRHSGLVALTVRRGVDPPTPGSSSLSGQPPPITGEGSPNSGEGSPGSGEGSPNSGEGSPDWVEGSPDWGEGSPWRIPVPG